MNNTFLDLYKEFLAFVDKGDEVGARKFLIDNLTKFPKDVQDKLAFAFFEEALTDEAKSIEDIAAVQKQGLEAMNQIDKAKKNIEDKAKIEALKVKLAK